MKDRVGQFFREKTTRRIVSVALFIGLLAAFHPLFLLLVFFVAFERGLGASAAFVRSRTRLKERASVLVVMFTTLAVIGIAIAFGAGRVAHMVVNAHDKFPEHLAALRQNVLYLQAKQHLPDTDRVVESLQQHAQDALHFVAALGHILAYATIGFILAVVYWLEHEELREFHDNLDPHSIIGTLIRWVEHAADAIAVTIQLQLIVALFNTVTTLPVLLLLGVPHVVPLMILVFLAALIPVVGNLVSGLVLSVLAYQAKGLWGVGIFVALTFALHKIEAYYLNPRLTARHVRLPGFVLIISLLCFEHVFGFAGLFLSFPFLFVAGRIRAEWQAHDDAARVKAKLAAKA